MISTENYVYAGKTLTFTADARLSLADFTPYDKIGYAFVGLRCADGSFAPSVIDAHAGDVYTAEYMPIDDEDFSIVGAQILLSKDEAHGEKHTLCFTIAVKNRLLRELSAPIPASSPVKTLGALTLPTDLTRGHEMKLDVKTMRGVPMYNECVSHLPCGDGTEIWSYAEQFGAGMQDRIQHKIDPTTWTSPNGAWSSLDGATVIFAEPTADAENDALVYSIKLDIAPEQYADFYSVKGYLCYTDRNGVIRPAYTKYRQASLYALAKQALSAENAAELSELSQLSDDATVAILQRIVTYCETDRKAAYFAVNYGEHGENAVSLRTEKRAGGEFSWEDVESGERIPGIVGKDFYRLKNGLIVREVEYNFFDGAYGKLEIVQAGDTHLNYINDRDLLEDDPCVFATYKGRAWNRDGGSVPCINAFMEYAGFFDMTVITGDILDFFSWGCAEMTEKLIVDRSKPEKLLMAIGNHEPAIHMIPIDHTCGHTDTSLEAIHGRLSQFWVNDTKYASKVLKNKDGREMVILAALDDQAHEFTWQEIYDGLEKDIAYARAHGLKMLLTAHCPMSTRGGREVDLVSYYYQGDTSYPKWNIDLGKREAGSTGKELDTKIHRLITDNADIIRGVFVGDYHSFMYTEIEGTDPNHIKIPQYVASANAYGPRVTKITVK